MEVARPPRSRAGPVRSAHGLCPSIRRRASCCSPAGRGQLVAPVLAPPTAVHHAPRLRHALPSQCTRLCSGTRLRPAHNWPGSTRDPWRVSRMAAALRALQHGCKGHPRRNSDHGLRLAEAAQAYNSSLAFALPGVGLDAGRRSASLRIGSGRERAAAWVRAPPSTRLRSWSRASPWPTLRRLAH